MNLAVAEQVIEAFFEGLQVRAEPRPDHDAVGIDGLAVFAVAFPSADRTEKAVFGEYPHWSIIPEEFGGDFFGGKNLVIRGRLSPALKGWATIGSRYATAGIGSRYATVGKR